jgi:tRNA(Ile)-lysidine synthetase-like protein
LKEIASRIWRAIIEFDLIQANDRILIGLSGGKDSLFLTYLLAHIRQHSARPFSLAAYSLDTRFSDSFPRQELADYCKQLDIPFDSSPVDVPAAIASAKSSDPCATCAYFRRGALNRIARERNFNKIALAHHHDDAVETFLMGLFYSGRLKTFLPKTSQERSGTTIIRPLIYFREAEIIAHANRLNLQALKNPCPYNGHTKRQEIKEMLYALEVKDPEYYRRFSAAMRGGASAELWPAEPGRYALKGRYLEFMGHANKTNKH